MSARVATCPTRRARPVPATIPSLVANRNLEASGYAGPSRVNGRRGMPAFGTMMNDGQVAAVVNYLRTHFGNNYQDAVTPEDVKDVRPKYHHPKQGETT